MPKIDYKMMSYILPEGFWAERWDDFTRRLTYIHNKDRRNAKRFYYGNRKQWSESNA